MSKGNLIMLPGITYSNSRILNIDTNLWTTQALLSKKLNLNRNVLSNRVRRYIKDGIIPDLYIESLDLRLVPNVLNINDLKDWRKITTKKL